TAKFTEAEVNFRPIGLSGPALLSQGQIDGYVWFKNQGLGLQAKGASVEVLDADRFIALPQDLILTTESLIVRRRAVLTAYLKLLKRATEYDRDPAHQAECDAYQAKYAPETVEDRQYLAVIREEIAARYRRDQAKGWRWGEILPEPLRVAQDFL